jgi:hypothetical protein
MINPLSGGRGFDFGVYSPRGFGFTMPKKSHLPFVVDCYFVWSLPFDRSGMGVPIRSLNSCQHSFPDHSRTHKPPHHDKVAVLEEGELYYLFKKTIYRCHDEGSRMRWLGKVTRMDDVALPKLLLFTES